MTGDVMARLDNLSDRVGIDLAAPAVDTERAADSVLVQQIDQTINADLAPVAAPCNAGEVDDARLGCGRLHSVRRRLTLRPSLQHYAHRDADALAIGPVEFVCQLNRLAIVELRTI